VFLREGYAGYVTPGRVLFLVSITSFLSSGRGLKFQLFDGHKGSTAVTVRSVGSLCTVWSRPSSTSREVYCHSVEELAFQLLNKRDVTLLQGGAM
jgi:hypothetical protein